MLKIFSLRADFLIQVVDASDREALRHYETTCEVLAELGAADKPMVVAALAELAKQGKLYYFHAEPFEYCLQNVKAIEKTDDMIQYEKIGEPV